MSAVHATVFRWGGETCALEAHASAVDIFIFFIFLDVVLKAGKVLRETLSSPM